MKVTTKTVCNVRPEVGSPVTTQVYVECGYRERQVGKIVETNYLGDYEWELIAEVDEDMVMNYFGDSIGFISMGVTSPDPLLNEYAEESEV